MTASEIISGRDERKAGRAAFKAAQLEEALYDEVEQMKASFQDEIKRLKAHIVALRDNIAPQVLDVIDKAKGSSHDE